MTDPLTLPLTTAEQDAIAYLRSPAAIRDRCGYLFELACADRLSHFRCDLSQLERVADYVLQVMRSDYPDLDVPFHSRWRHFEVGGPARLQQLDQHLASLSLVEQAQAKFDLAVVSVLLDAGAGADWQYVEPGTGQVWQRSEGLAVASFHLFMKGMFSSDRTHPLRVDAFQLQQLTESELADGFQVSAHNPLVGVSGRLGLLQRLGQALQENPHWFGTEPPRPGALVNGLIEQSEEKILPANAVLQAVLAGLGDIWPGRVAIAQINLGDVWLHPALPNTGVGSQLVPFHKLSQWLTYSLLEPLQTLGIEITGLNQLTGLPEYRNGGLCLDLGLLQTKHEAVRGDRHLPSSEIVVEWRALTVILLDQIADMIRQKLNLEAADLPLVKVLQGGTWTAGRKIAATLRPGGPPPISLESDGTVF